MTETTGNHGQAVKIIREAFDDRVWGEAGEALALAQVHATLAVADAINRLVGLLACEHCGQRPRAGLDGRLCEPCKDLDLWRSDHRCSLCSGGFSANPFAQRSGS